MRTVIYCSLFVTAKDWKQSKCHRKKTGQVNSVLFIQTNAIKS